MLLFHRNIIEKNNKTLVDWRRTHFSESDAATLDLFKRAKEGEWQKERQQTRPQQRPVIWIMVFIAILFCGLVAIIVSSELKYRILSIILDSRQFCSQWYILEAIQT